MSKKKKSKIKCGIITAWEILRMGRGHSAHTTGTGPHRNRKYDKKLRRDEDRKECDD